MAVTKVRITTDYLSVEAIWQIMLSVLHSFAWQNQRCVIPHWHGNCFHQEHTDKDSCQDQWNWVLYSPFWIYPKVSWVPVDKKAVNVSTVSSISGDAALGRQMTNSPQPNVAHFMIKYMLPQTWLRFFSPYNEICACYILLITIILHCYITIL